MKDVIEKLEMQIQDCKDFKEDLDSCSWHMQTGIIISADTAQRIVNALRRRDENSKREG